jgi:hypothetical protein
MEFSMRVSVKNGELQISRAWRVRQFVVCWLAVSAFWLADRLPWFARKRVINWLADREVLTDLSDYHFEAFVQVIRW